MYMELLKKIDTVMEFVMGIVVYLLAALGILYTLMDVFIHKEDESIKKEVDKTLKDIQKPKDYDVFKLLYKNVTETTQYYIISKRQASKSFALAVISCILGVVIYICGFLVVSFFDKNIIIFTTISGTVVEIITGLSFWIYNKCTKQLNEYHKRLSSTEKYLTSIQMADKMSENGREEMYKWLIQNVMLLDTNYYKIMQNKDNNESQ